MKTDNLKLIFLKAAVVAIPAYSVALATEKVTLVVPTLAMFLLIANSIESGTTSSRNRIDEDGVSQEDSDVGDGGLGEGDGGV